MKRFRGLVLLLAMAIMPLVALSQTAGEPPKSGTPSLEKTILDKEKASWETLKQKNYSAFGELLAADYVGIDNTGISSRTELLKSMPELRLLDYTMEDVKVLSVANGVTLITYKAKLSGSYQGKQLKPIYAASVWVKRGSKWLQTFNQETEAQ
jgi:hypothetical protein